MQSDPECHIDRQSRSPSQITDPGGRQPSVRLASSMMRNGCGGANAKVLVKTNGYRSIAGSSRTDGVPKLLGREFTLAPANPQTPSISDRDGRLHPRRLHQPPTSQPSTTPVLFSPRDAHYRKCNKQPFHLHYLASCLTSHLNCLTMRRDALGDRNIKIKKRHVQKLDRWHGERKSLNNHRRAVVY